MRGRLGMVAVVVALAATVAAPAGSADHSAPYWTQERMRAASPLDTVVVAGRAPIVARDTYPFGFTRRAWDGPATRMPASTVGRVFFTDAATRLDYSCSGTVVSSRNRMLVWTAGHCVHGGEGGTWHRNWAFAPAYRDGRTPYGLWYSSRLGTLNAWATGSNVRYDVGAALMARREGRRIGAVVGGQGIAFDSAATGRLRIFGYPAAPQPLAGARLHICTGALSARDPAAPGEGPEPLAMGCDLGSGVSGGAWIKDFNGRAGYVVSVVSYKYAEQPLAVYGPYLGAEAHGLYRTMSR